MKINEEYTSVEVSLPEPRRDIYYVDDKGNTGSAYLCPCCKKEWRCCITGGGLLINVVSWRYVDEDK